MDGTIKGRRSNRSRPLEGHDIGAVRVSLVLVIAALALGALALILRIGAPAGPGLADSPSLAEKLPMLVLEERHVAAIPDTTDVLGLFAGYVGGVLVVTRNPSAVALLDSTLAFVEQVRLPANADIVSARALDGDEMELLWRDPPMLLRASWDGTNTVRPITLGKSRSVIVDGTPGLDGHWVLLVRDRTSGVPEIVDVAKDGSVVGSRSIPDLHALGDLQFVGFVRSDRSHILIGESHEPHRTFRVSTVDSQVTTSFQDVAGLLPHRNTTWVGLPILPLDYGYLQVLSNPRSDDRLLVLFSPEGCHIRSKALSASYGIALTDPLRRRAVGLRRVPHAEVVLYDWSWTGPDAHDSPSQTDCHA